MNIRTRHSIGDRVSWWCDDRSEVIRSVIDKVEAVANRDGSVETTYWTMVKFHGRNVPAFFTDNEVRSRER